MELVNCPVDKSHTIKPARLTEHMKDCQLKAAGFSNLSVKVIHPSISHISVLFKPMYKCFSKKFLYYMVLLFVLNAFYYS